MARGSARSSPLPGSAQRRRRGRCPRRSPVRLGRCRRRSTRRPDRTSRGGGRKIIVHEDHPRSGECGLCPASVARCAHWGRYLVRLYPPSRFEARLAFWGVEGPGRIDVQRSRREGTPDWSMYLPQGPRYSSRHADEEHARLDFEARAAAMRNYPNER